VPDQTGEHQHDHHHLPVGAATRRLLSLAAVFLAAVTGVGMALLWPRHEPPKTLAEYLPSIFYDARVDHVDNRPCGGPGGASGPSATPPSLCPRASVTVLEGPDKGSQIGVDVPDNLNRSRIGEGDKIVLSYSPQGEPELRYAFSDRQRKPVLFWVAVAFAIVVVVLGRLRGLAALVGLTATLVILLIFVMPALLDGRSPVAVAVVGAAAIAFLAIYLAHGVGPMTTVALLGTLGSLVLTAVLAAAVTHLAALSGYASEEASIVQLAGNQLDVAGLVLAGIVIGALGAIDDMTVTQVAAVAELHAANPRLGRPRLYRAALRIGRDHVASTVNTLALAYAGASIPLFLLLVMSRQSLGSVANGEVVATEIIRTLVGSIGLVASVPLTTWLAVRCTPTPSASSSPSGSAPPPGLTPPVQQHP
jgi:uncharacterized membrane protein